MQGFAGLPDMQRKSVYILPASDSLQIAPERFPDSTDRKTATVPA